MYCPSCGVQNEANAQTCYRCGGMLPQNGPGASPPQAGGYGGPPYGPGPGAAPPNIPSHLGWAIVTTLLCCLPFGVVAIVYASSVGSKLAAYDYQGAMEASRKAKNWCWAAFISGFLIMALVIIVNVFVILISEGVIK